MAPVTPESLQRRWVHSHEEDSDDEMVFRPAGWEFPPARGRQSFELRPDGTYLGSGPGPDDRPVESTGTWSLEGDRLVFEAPGDAPNQAWQVASVEGDRLTVKR
jgi:hypothetical protein